MNVLLAIDSSTESDLAIKAVAARPWPASTTIDVLTVVEPIYTSEIHDLMNTLKQQAHEVVEAAAQQLRSSGIRPTTMLVLCGNPKGVIVEHARRTDTGLIVVGSHRVAAAGAFLRGSVARAVVRFAPCSVEVIRGEASAGAMKILLATDGSRWSEAAARSLAERPWPSGTQLRILSVGDHRTRLYSAGHRLDARVMEKLQQEAMERAQQAVSCAEEIMQGRFPVSAIVAASLAAPKELILKEAADWNANLIVLGCNGEGGLARLLLGSVSEAVAMHASCSVEVIRSGQS